MNLEKHGPGEEQAWRMLDLFAGLDVHTFDLTLTDIDGHKQGFHPAQSVETLRRWMPSLLRSAIQYRQNLIVRPKRTAAALVQLDDLGGAMLARVRNAAFLILMTSGGNHQAWVAVQECGPDFARRLRKGSGADPSASGAARVAGSVNFKRKYAPAFPTVQILEATPQRTITRGELEAFGLVAAPEPVSAICAGRADPHRRPKAWPSYERCLQNAPPTHLGDRPDVSRADFTFCLLAIDWGWSLAETCERLLEKSSKARENGEGYAWLTTQHAAAAVDRRQGRFAGSGPALGRSRLPDFEKAGSYPHPQPKPRAPGPSAGCEHSFVDARVSAEPAIALGG
jgi:hypothetical protein